MKKRVMALLLAASLAATAFAGCGSSKDTGKSNDTKAKTESQSEEKDTSKDATSGKTDDGKYVDVDAVKASLEKSLAQQDATMQNVANSLTSYIDQDPIKVRVEYVDADGTTLCKKEYTSGN